MHFNGFWMLLGSSSDDPIRLKHLKMHQQDPQKLSFSDLFVHIQKAPNSSESTHKTTNSSEFTYRTTNPQELRKLIPLKEVLRNLNEVFQVNITVEDCFLDFGSINPNFFSKTNDPMEKGNNPSKQPNSEVNLEKEKTSNLNLEQFKPIQDTSNKITNRKDIISFLERTEKDLKLDLKLEIESLKTFTGDVVLQSDYEDLLN